MAKHIISVDLLGMELRQLGASKVQINSSKVLYVQFDIKDNLCISYFFNIRDEGKIYIQRIEPYPIRNYGFETVENILSFVRRDVELFANASKSSNFPLFLKIIDTNYYVRKELEQLFLMRNVPHGLLEELLEDDLRILEKIKGAEFSALEESLSDISEDYVGILDGASIISTADYNIDEFATSQYLEGALSENDKDE